jgi:poly(A) polymerase
VRRTTPSTAAASTADALRLGATRLVEVVPLLGDLPSRFAQAGHTLALVGGPVRDALMGQVSEDLDLTTDARPERITELMRGWADAIWDVGAAFGTIGAQYGGHRVEVTTFRADAYERGSRKPEVDFGTSLEGDLGRRDFTVNAMAVLLPGLTFVDPFNGVEDVVARRLRTPGAASDSFDDDPLRMMRAARFASQLGFAVDADVVEAMTAMAERISIVSAERVRDEIVKLVLGDAPRVGLELLVRTGLADLVLPELPKLALEIDEHHRHKDVYEHTLTVLEQAIELEQGHEPTSEPDFILRFAALMHDIGKPRTRKFEPGGGVSFHHHEVVGAKMTTKRMRALRFSNEEIEQVSRLVELHLRFHGYGAGEWTDSAVRRYVRDAGDLLVRLHKLTRADSTTRNRRKAAALARSYDDLETRIARLQEEEELASLRPDLDGTRIMEVLGIPPGPAVGRAYAFLLEHRLDHGPSDPADAEQLLREWWATQA